MRAVDKEMLLSAVSKATSLERGYAFSVRAGSGLQYSLMVGAFDDLADVQSALADLQPYFQSIRIRRLGALQSEWCEQLDNLTPEQLSLVLEKCSS